MGGNTNRKKNCGYVDIYIYNIFIYIYLFIYIYVISDMDVIDNGVYLQMAILILKC